MADKEHGANGAAGGGGAAHGGGHSAGGGGAHGGGSHEEHEGAPEWLISFADNTALMMGFFVILLCLNMGPKGAAGASESKSESKAAQESGQTPEMLDWVLAVRRAFHNPVSLNSTDPHDRVLVMRMRELMARQNKSEDAGVHGEKHQTQSVREADYHGFYAYLPFDNNASAITAAAKQTLAETAEKLRGVKLIIDVRGHASAAEAYERPDHAMQLSFDRALAVAHALADSGIDWRQIRLVPCGDNDRIRPIAYDRPGHAKNECAEVVVTDEVLKD